MQKILRMKEVVVFSNKYGILYNDEVQGPTGNKGSYLRWKWNENGVIVVPVFNGKFALAQMYRYPPGIFSLEFPGGGVKENETVEDAATRELYEELGFSADQVFALGKIYPDTGILAGAITVLAAYLKTEQTAEENAQEAMEAISKDIIWRSFSEFKEDTVSGKIMAGTTISSAMLYLSWAEHH